MSYATTADTVEFIAASRLADITGDTAGVNVSTDPPPSNERNSLFRDASLGNDLSGYTAQQQADVALALKVLQTALDSATSLIDSYLVARYTLPLSTYPKWIKEACASFANCSLHDDVDIEAIVAKCDKYRELLEDVASGKLKLYPATDDSGEQLTNSNISVQAPTRVFTQSVLNKVI
jgi:phage gp36-like protein